MKQIFKIEPAIFNQFIAKNSPQTWGELSKKIGDELRLYMLINEQNNQCAYTEVRLQNKHLESHIDHFQKQSLFPELKFVWNNLLTSCNNEHYGARYKDKYIQKIDYEFLIHPAKTNPDDHLTYSTTGEILSKDKYGKTTIDLFNLNDKSLVEQRKTIAKQLKEIYQEFDIEELVSQYGKFESFIREIYKIYQISEN